MGPFWIRIRLNVAGKTVWGHAGRFGFIYPNEKGVRGYHGTTYGGDWDCDSDTVCDLKRMLDAEDPDAVKEP